MRSLVKFYYRMALLQANPQDGPYSQTLQLVLLLLCFLVSVITALALYELWPSIAHSILDLAFLYLFTLVLLSSAKERIKQTFCAFLGSGFIISVVNAFAFNGLIENKDVDTVTIVDMTVFFMIFAWTVLVYGHIVRHAIDVKLSSGMGIILAYTLITMILRQALSTALGI